MRVSSFLPVRQFRLFTKLDIPAVQEKIREDTEPMDVFNLPDLFRVKKYEGRITATGFTVRKKTRTGHDPNPVAEAVCSVLFDKRTMVTVRVRPTIGGIVFMTIWFGITGVAAAVAWSAYMNMGLPSRPALKQPVFLTLLFTVSYCLFLLSSKMSTNDYKKYLQELLTAVDE